MASDPDDDRAATVRDLVPLADLEPPDDPHRTALLAELSRLTQRMAELEAAHADIRKRLLAVEILVSGFPRSR